MNLIYGALLIVKYSLQSIILLIVYVVLMNLFVDKMVAASLKLLSEMESASVPSNEHASTSGSNANSSSMRAKCDLAWDHVTEELKEGKSSCLFETFLLFECNELIYLVRSLSETYLLFGCNELICYLPFGCKCYD